MLKLLRDLLVLSFAWGIKYVNHTASVARKEVVL